jgi:tRNA wybutosine-synthesizing protein 1
MFCANRCTFCWRGAKAPVSKDWYGPVDEPSDIIIDAHNAQQELLVGFKGHPNVNMPLYDQSKAPRHVALSLTGEPITYPKMKELCDEFHRQRISTFIVTNAQYPEAIEKIDYCTQLYISLDAPTKELLKKIDRPLFEDYYERLLKSLDVLAKKAYRTCIRLTVIKDVNDTLIEEYAKLIRRGRPDFIEVKSYMHVGASRNFLQQENMPSMEDIRAFTAQLLEILDEYEYVNEQAASRVTCLMKKEMNGKNFIDFPKFFQITESKATPHVMHYSSATMQPNM